MITGKRPTLVRGDIRDEKALEKLFADFPIDAVINFAGRKASASQKPILCFTFLITSKELLFCFAS